MEGKDKSVGYRILRLLAYRSNRLSLPKHLKRVRFGPHL
jgi:hypothetical protein